jgi:DNA replication protein DnaC
MDLEQLLNGLKRLRLNAIARDYAIVSSESEKLGRSYEQHLAALVEIELTDKTYLKRDKLIREAKFPLVKLISDFDYSHCKGVCATQVTRLCQGDFLHEAANIIFYGSFGVGKSHLAMAIARELCLKEYRCLFTSTAALINDLCLAQQSLSLSSLFRKLDKYDLVILDELGYTPQSKDGTDLFFQFISERYERKSLMITTNLPYSEWDKVFLSKTTTAAAVDRIIHKSETFNITGPSRRALEAQRRGTLPDAPIDPH